MHMKLTKGQTKRLEGQILPTSSLLRTHVLNLSLKTNSKNSSPIEYLVLIKGFSL